MARNPVGWFEIYVDDMARAKTFYETVLQVKLDRLETPMPGLEMWAMPMSMEVYGAAGALVKMDGFKPAIGGTLVYFSCDDVAVEEARVVAAGGKVQQPKMSIGQYGFISLIVDSEGNMIGLHSMAQ